MSPVNQIKKLALAPDVDKRARALAEMATQDYLTRDRLEKYAVDLRADDPLKPILPADLLLVAYAETIGHLAKTATIAADHVELLARENDALKAENATLLKRLIPDGMGKE